MRRIACKSSSLAIAAFSLFLAACHGNGGFSSSPELPAANLRQRQGPVRPLFHAMDKIKHIVIIVQENRSLNDLFYAFPGADTVKYGYDTANRRIALKPITLATTWDVEHNSEGFIAACNGTGKNKTPGTDCRMNGFNKETWQCDAPGYPHCPIRYPPYSYVPHSETAPYFAMAKQYVLADEMYASNFDASSFVSHQYIIGAQAASTTNYPNGQWGCAGGVADTIPLLTQERVQHGRTRVCFDYTTLGDELDNAGLSWAFYTYPIGSGGKTCGSGTEGDYYESNGIWSAYQAIRHICYGPDWSQDVITPATQFLTDVANGELRAVTWITPTCKNSDHAGCGGETGPSWVASLVNAIGESKFWDSTAIFIFWDDYGGWYDPKPPAYVDYDGLGGRIPMLIVSPYAKKGHVSHVHYEHGSILKFIEHRFGLASLSASDKRANSPDPDCFDFMQSPRKFVQIQAPYDANYFMHQPLDTRPPDTN